MYEFTRNDSIVQINNEIIQEILYENDIIIL